LPASGSFLGPSTIRAIARTMIISMGPIPAIGLTPSVRELG
jgi:hypothetical protein